jgi:hypothetical protein
MGPGLAVAAARSGRGCGRTALREKVEKIGAKVIAHSRYAIFQMAGQSACSLLADCHPIAT